MEQYRSILSGPGIGGIIGTDAADPRKGAGQSGAQAVQQAQFTFFLHGRGQIYPAGPGDELSCQTVAVRSGRGAHEIHLSIAEGSYSGYGLQNIGRG